LRAVAAIPPVQHVIAGLLTAPQPLLGLVELVEVGAAALLLVGFWTPVAGALMATVQLYLAFSHYHDPWIHITLGTVAAALAMLGPGPGPWMRVDSDGSAFKSGTGELEVRG